MLSKVLSLIQLPLLILLMLACYHQYLLAVDNRSSIFKKIYLQDMHIIHINYFLTIFFIKASHFFYSSLL